MPWRNYIPSIRLLSDIASRIALFVIFFVTENTSPFVREIQPEEYWLYKYPSQKAYVSTGALYAIVIICDVAVILLFYFVNRNPRESWQAFLVPTLSHPLTGVVTNFIKIAVGRPRPDFFDRCYPGRKTFDATATCTGDFDKVEEGRKSFPSGHASVSFCAMGFISLYLAGKLGAFSSRGRGESWKILSVITPWVVALMISISRTCDYHHHWQDIAVGAALGTVITYLVYRQYYPSLFDTASDIPICFLRDVNNGGSSLSLTNTQAATSSSTLVKNI